MIRRSSDMEPSLPTRTAQLQVLKRCSPERLRPPHHRVVVRPSDLPARPVGPLGGPQPLQLGVRRDLVAEDPDDHGPVLRPVVPGEGELPRRQRPRRAVGTVVGDQGGGQVVVGVVSRRSSTALASPSALARLASRSRRWR